MTMNHHDSDRERRDIEITIERRAELLDEWRAASPGVPKYYELRRQIEDITARLPKYVRVRSEILMGPAIPPLDRANTVTLVLHADGCVTWQSGS